MSKPYPCCCGCVHCPQYDLLTDDWEFLLSGINGPGLGITFTSSTTGNALHTDLNSLSSILFYFDSVSTAGNTRQAFYTSSILLPGNSWTYSGFLFGPRTLSNVFLELRVFDECSKVYVNLATIWAFDGTTNVIAGGYGGPGVVPGSPNCGSVLNRAFNFSTDYMDGSIVGGSIQLTPP